MYLDYQVYGDFVTAELINNMNEQNVNIKNKLLNFNSMLEADKHNLTAHKEDTAPHGATNTATANSLVLRTGRGTIKASNAVDGDDLVNLTVLTEKQTAQEEKTENKIIKERNLLTQVIQARIAAISKGDMEGNSEEEQTAALNTHTNTMAAYMNVIRNEHGSIAVPNAVNNTEVINKQQLEVYTAEKIAALVGTAPEVLDTLGEIASALTENQSCSLYKRISLADFSDIISVTRYFCFA